MAALERVAIQHYRGFYHRREIHPAIPNGAQGSGLTVLVGPNNSGKTTVLDAIRLVVGGALRVDMEHRHPNHALAISLRNGDGGEKTLTNPNLDALAVVQGDQGGFPTLQDTYIVPSRRAWNPYTEDNNFWKREDYWQHRMQWPKEQDSQFVARIAELNVEGRAAYNRLLKELLPQLSSWKIELSRSQTFIQYETAAGAQHAGDLFGDGMASLFRLALALHDSAPEKIVLIDEPELSLHPQAQKLLARVLARFASDRQIIVTTHSPYFVNWSDLVAGARIYRLTQSADGVDVGGLEDETLAQLARMDADWQKPSLLDAVAKEIFFADEVIFFEGQEDVGLIRKFCDDKGLPPLSAFGYGAGGFGNLKHFLRMASDLGIPAAAIYDGDQAEAKEEAEREFPDAFIEILPTPDIRDKPARGPDGQEVVKEGIFDHRGVIKAEHEDFLAGLLNRIGDALRRG